MIISGLADFKTSPNFEVLIKMPPKLQIKHKPSGAEIDVGKEAEMEDFLINSSFSHDQSSIQGGWKLSGWTKINWKVSFDKMDLNHEPWGQ